MYNIYMYKQRFSQILLLPPAQVKAILDVPVQNSEQAATKLHLQVIEALKITSDIQALLFLNS